MTSSFWVFFLSFFYFIADVLKFSQFKIYSSQSTLLVSNTSYILLNCSVVRRCTDEEDMVPKPRSWTPHSSLEG